QIPGGYALDQIVVGGVDSRGVDQTAGDCEGTNLGVVRCIGKVVGPIVVVRVRKGSQELCCRNDNIEFFLRIDKHGGKRLRIVKLVGIADFAAKFKGPVM